MADALVVRLRPTTASGPEAEWLPVDTTGSRLGSVAHGSLEQAAAACGTRKAIVLVPATDVLLAQPELPVKAGARLAQIAPFALEDQLADDLEDVHVAIGRREAAPGTPLAAVGRKQMDAWMSRLQAAALPTSSLYAESDALPAPPAGVTMLLEGMTLLVRRPGEPPFVLDCDPLIESLQTALSAGGDAREHVTLYAVPGDYEREREIIEGLREFTASLQVKLLADGPLPLLALSIVSRPGVNLLQGAYAIKSRLEINLAPWRYAAALLGGLIVLHFGVEGTRLWQLSREDARLDAEMAQVFSQAMPGVRQVDARAQMEQRLLAVRGGGALGGLLLGLDTLGAAVSQTPDTRLEALSYRDNTLDLRLLVPSVDALDRIQQLIAERGGAAEIQSANPRESRVEGRLQLRSAAGA